MESPRPFDSDRIDTTLRVQATADCKITAHSDMEMNGRYASFASTRSASANAEKGYEGVEAAAEALYKAIHDPQQLFYEVFDKDAFKEQVADDESLTISDRTVKISGKPRPETVWLAAGKRAAFDTKQSMVRKGYSVENILLRYARLDDDDVKSRGETTSKVHGLSNIAHGLVKHRLRHTPGGDIEAEALDGVERFAAKRDEMMPDND